MGAACPEQTFETDTTQVVVSNLDNHFSTCLFLVLQEQKEKLHYIYNFTSKTYFRTANAALIISLYLHSLRVLELNYSCPPDQAEDPRLTAAALQTGNTITAKIQINSRRFKWIFHL